MYFIELVAYKGSVMNDNFKARVFSPKRCRRTRVFKGKPLRTKVSTIILQNGKQTIRLASISKANLCFDVFQRPHESKRSEKIQKEFHQDFSVVNVSECFHEGKWYYTITDGQHRSFANPEDRIGCIITNGLKPAHAFLLGNSNTKTVGKDDELWALYEAGELEARWLFSTLRKFGFMPYRLSGDEGKQNVKNGRFVGTAKLYQVLKQIKTDASKDNKKMPSDQVDELTRERFIQMLEIMTGVWGAEAFHASQNKIERSRSKAAYRDVWMAMLKVMNGRSWPTSTDTIVKALSKGHFSKNGRGPVAGERYLTLEDIPFLAKKHYADIIAKGSEQNRQIALASVIDSMIKCGKKV